MKNETEQIVMGVDVARGPDRCVDAEFENGELTAIRDVTDVQQVEVRRRQLFIDDRGFQHCRRIIARHGEPLEFVF